MFTFGERLKAARERKGLTQAQVMKATGITDKSISRYETGASAPDPDTILELIRLYDVSSDYIMGLSSKMGHTSDSSERGEGKSTGKDRLLSIYRKLTDNNQKKVVDFAEFIFIQQEKSLKKLTTVKIAARDGTYKELQLTDEQLQELIKKTEALEDAPDDL